MADSWGGRRHGGVRAVASSQTSRAAVRGRSRTLVLAGLVFLLAFVGAGFRSGAGWGATSPRFESFGATRSVIVRALPGSEGKARAAVVRLGGTVGVRLGLINGFAATVPAARLGTLKQLPFVVSATPNTRIKALGADYSGVSATGDAGSMYTIVRSTGAQKYWQNGYTGKGVGIALIDSGVANVDGLQTAGKVVNGPDLSFESQSDTTRYVDTYGHGTHLAGIIAGRANAANPATYTSDSVNFLGMAPDAKLISLKVANREGATDVSQVIAAIDWVVQHKDDAGLNIRVLNLSYGTDTDQPYAVDPLAYAAEQAWKRGIVVVAAAGNAGRSRGGTLTNPAYDPFVLAVGSAETNGTVSQSDDTVSTFSSTGGKGRNPDVIAPGAHVISLRAPGSDADVNYGSTGLVNESLFRGSGTSQAAAVVSGAAALILQQRPTITPDQLKKLLTNGAVSVQNASGATQGSGEINLQNSYGTKTPSWKNNAAPASGGGSLEWSRGSQHVTNNGVDLTGEQDIFGMPFDAAAMASLEASASSWSGGMWNGSSWSGSSWSASSWSGSSWSASSWSGSSWSGSSWSASSWSASSWSASSWSASSWSASSWSSSSWSSAGWLGASWD